MSRKYTFSNLLRSIVYSIYRVEKIWGVVVDVSYVRAKFLCGISSRISLLELQPRSMAAYTQYLCIDIIMVFVVASG